MPPPPAPLEFPGGPVQIVMDALSLENGGAGIRVIPTPSSTSRRPSPPPRPAPWSTAWAPRALSSGCLSLSLAPAQEACVPLSARTRSESVSSSSASCPLPAPLTLLPQAPPPALPHVPAASQVRNRLSLLHRPAAMTQALSNSDAGGSALGGPSEKKQSLLFRDQEKGGVESL